MGAGQIPHRRNAARRNRLGGQMMYIAWNFPVDFVKVIQNAWAPSTTFEKPYNPIQDMRCSDGGAPSTPSGVAPSGDTCKSTDVVYPGPCVVRNEGPPSLPATGPDLKDCIPALGRDLQPVLYTDACGAMPSGGDWPSLIPPQSSLWRIM